MHNKLILIGTTLLVTLTLPACGQVEPKTDCDQLVFENSWIREAPPGVEVLAGYMNMKNTGDQVITVTSAKSPAFKRIEFHQTVHKVGSIKMQPLPVLEIPANADLPLEPGGRHMMLFNPDKDYKADEKVAIEFTCSSREVTKAEFLVKKTLGNGGTSHHHHNH